eukprot:385937_1
MTAPVSITFQHQGHTYTKPINVPQPFGKPSVKYITINEEKRAAIIFNQVVWYGARLIYFDARARENGFLEFKLCEIGFFNYNNDTQNILNTVKAILQHEKPYKLLQQTYQKFIKDKVPPTRKFNVDPENPLPLLQRGDVVIAKKRLFAWSGLSYYDHYGVYKGMENGNAKVIHFTGSNRNNANIQESNWETFAGDSPVIRAEYTPLNVTTITERIDLAEQMVNLAHNGQYDIWKNNCEHFARFILYGYSHCTQNQFFAAVLNPLLNFDLRNDVDAKNDYEGDGKNDDEGIKAPIEGNNEEGTTNVSNGYGGQRGQSNSVSNQRSSPLNAKHNHNT